MGVEIAVWVAFLIVLLAMKNSQVKENQEIWEEVYTKASRTSIDEVWNRFDELKRDVQAMKVRPEVLTRAEPAKIVPIIATAQKKRARRK